MLTVVCEFSGADQRSDLKGIVGIQCQRPGAHLHHFLNSGCTGLQQLSLLLLQGRRQSKVDLRTIFRFLAVNLSNNNAFSALTLLDGRQEEHPACEN